MEQSLLDDSTVTCLNLFFSLDVLAGEIAKIFVFSSDKKLTHCWLGQAVLFARDRFPSQRKKNL